MYKKIAFVLAVAVLTIACMPAYTFAADEGLEKAIKTVKQYFSIPDNFTEFDYGINSAGDRKIWQLNWTSKDGDGLVGASVDSNGDIISYIFYDNTDYNSSKKIPKISRQEAQAKAEEIIKKINPGIFENLKFVDSFAYQGMLNDDAYYFTYIRTHNGIPLPENNICVGINRNTGEVRQYTKQWNNDTVFPSSEKALSIEEAQKAYIENLGLRLTYYSRNNGDKTEVYAAYTPIFESDYYIDAITGEKVYLGYSYNGAEEWSYDGALKNVAVGRGETVALSPQEIDAINEVSKLLTQEEAEKKVREIKLFELDENYIVNSASLSTSWTSKNDFAWNLYFEKEVSGTNKEYDFLYIAVDAKTGEIRSFSRPFSNIEDIEPKFDKEASKAEVEKVIKELQPEKFAQTEYQELYNDRIYNNTNEKPKTYGFSYVRKVNGVLFPENNISVTFDAVNGKIVNFYTRWSEVDFPSVEKVIPLSEIYEKLFSEIGLKLQYRIDTNAQNNSEELAYEKIDIIQAYNKNIKLRLIYAFDEGKPIRFDAFSGEILDYEGKPYKENKIQEYNDISGHYAEDIIKLLAEMGIALEGPEFKPNEEIKQKDFLLLISQIIDGGYRFFGKTALKENKEIEDLYTLLIREGIVKQNEKDPEAPLTREESVKFIIRVLRYDKIAELTDIFNCTFKDKDDISSDLIGYVVLAKGLKLVSGDGEYFRPKNKLTRADAILIIYNYLNIL